MQQVFSGPRPLTHLLRTVMKPVFRRRSFTEASIILDWHRIMNKELAECCYPERLIFPRGKKEGGTLVISVDSASSLMIQHSEMLLINWINSYFGYLAVNRIKLKHTYIAKPNKAKINALPEVSTISALPLKENLSKNDNDFDDIEDAELKMALLKFRQSYHHYITPQVKVEKNSQNRL